VSLLLDLGRHQVWADAEQWHAFRQFPSALRDEVIRGRLHHLHQVQEAFCWVMAADGSRFERTTPADFESDRALEAFAQRASGGVLGLDTAIRQ
jgi:hypothetical protein